MADFEEIEDPYEEEEYDDSDEYEDKGEFFPKNEISEKNISVSQRNTQREEKPHEIKEDKKYLKIEIDSIDKLIGSLRFTTANFEKAMDRVESNNDLKAVLGELQKISKQDFDFLKDVDIAKRLQSQINQVDTDQITKTINAKMQKSIQILDTTAQHIKKYSDAFNDEEVIGTLDKIESIERFTRSFKFKSIVFSCIFGFIISFFVTYFATQFLFEPQKQKTDTTANSDLSAFFAQIDYNFAQNEKVIQLQIPKTTKNQKIQVGIDNQIQFIQITK